MRRQQSDKKRMSGRKKCAVVLIGIAAVLAAVFAGAAIYLNIYYAPDATAVQVLATQTDVAVTEEDNWFFFDGAGEETAMVFYPGGKVDSAAYAPLMRQIAADGVDCYLLKLPFRIAFLDTNAADRVTSQGQYRRYLVAGHSLGGVAASSYCASHAEKVSGLVLLAGYPTAPLPERLPVLSVVGDRDGVLRWDTYNSAKQYWNSRTREVVIHGGNHAGFGSYGRQDGDNDADITAQEQQRQTAQAVSEWARERQ